MYTTLNAIRKHITHREGWETLLKYLGKTKPDSEPLSLLTILDVMGFEEALRCLSSVKVFEKEKRLLAITYAREVEHLMHARSKKALYVFERYLNGLATKKEFEAARASGDAAAYTCPAYSEAYYAAWSTCPDAADAAAHAAQISDATASDIYSTIRAKQENQLRQLLEKTCTQP